MLRVVLTHPWGKYGQTQPLGLTHLTQHLALSIFDPNLG